MAACKGTIAVFPVIADILTGGALCDTESLASALHFIDLFAKAFDSATSTLLLFIERGGGDLPNRAIYEDMRSWSGNYRLRFSEICGAIRTFSGDVVTRENDLVAVGFDADRIYELAKTLKRSEIESVQICS
jgi:hypothetical protein